MLSNFNHHQLLFCLRNGLWHGERLKEWDTVKASGLNDAKFVSMLEQVDDDKRNGVDSIVVSTMEKVHRVHGG